MKTPEIKLTTLPNQIRVVSQYIPTSSFTAGIWLDAGSRYESRENNGSAHFLEHLLFKGTNRRTIRDLEKSVEDHGCRLNAYTSREMTAYFIQSTNNNIDFSLDILSDMFLHSKLDKTNIENEKSTIIRESEDVASMKDESVMDLLHEAAYGEEGLGLTILGSENNIKSMKRKNLLDYIKKHYIGNRMIIACCGGIKHDNVFIYINIFILLFINYLVCKIS